MAQAGLILGLVGLAILALFILWFVFVVVLNILFASTTRYTY